MKLTQMIEKFAKQGMLNGVARAELLQAAEETEQKMAELQEENEALKTKVSSLETNLDNTQMALCDVYEQLIAVTSAADKEA